MKTRFHVKFGHEAETIVIVDENKIDLTQSRWPRGFIGAAIELAVKKLFGKNSVWFANSDNAFYGQVFTPLPKNLGTGNYSRTAAIILNVTERPFKTKLKKPSGL